MSNQASDQAAKAMALAREQLEVREQAAFDQILHQFPTVVRCEANKNIMTEYCSPFELSVEGILLAFEDQDPRSGLAFKLALQPVENQRNHLIEEILGLLAGGHKYTEFDIKNERVRMAFGTDWTVDKLRARKAEIESKQAQQALPKEELRKIVRAGNTRYTVEDNYQLIPPEIDSRAIRRMTPQQYKDLMKRHGGARITARLQGRD